MTRAWTGGPSRAARLPARRWSRCRPNENNRGPGVAQTNAILGIRMSQPVLEIVSGGKPADSRAALRELYTKYGGTVYGRCQYILRDATKAEDAMQDVFAKALTHWSEFRSEASPLTWLTRIATHHCLNVLRAERAPWHQRFAPRDAGARRRTRRAPAVRGSRRRAQAAGRARPRDAAGGDSLLRGRDDAGRGRGCAGRSVPTVRKRLAAVAALAGRAAAARGRDEMNTEGHIGELELRRRRAGEALGAEGPAIEAHAAACAECKARIRALDDEQRRFEAAISFDRFAAGVERAARGTPAVSRRRAPIRGWMVVPTLAMAAAVAVMVTFHGLPWSWTRVHPPGYDGIKGGAGMLVRVAGAAGQRTARVDATEPLSAGERLRIGYQTGGHRYLLSLSIDEHGEVTPLYPETGGQPDRACWRLQRHTLSPRQPGADGDRPRADHRGALGSAGRRAGRSPGGARRLRSRGRDLGHLPRLDLPGEQFTRTFAKP